MASIVKKSAGEIFVKRIRDAMWERNITVTWLANKLDVGRTTMYRYLKCPGDIPLATAIQLIKAVGIQSLTLEAGGFFRETTEW